MELAHGLHRIQRDPTCIVLVPDPAFDLATIPKAVSATETRITAAEMPNPVVDHRAVAVFVATVEEDRANVSSGQVS